MEELVLDAKRRGVHIRLLLLDKGFYSHEVIKTLKALGVRFLNAVPKNKRVKEAVLDYFRTGKEQVRRFSLKKDGETVNFNLTIHRLRKSKKGLKNILELYGAFATNIGPKKALKAWSQLPEDYRKRWGIETGFRVGKSFRAKTTSRNETVREIYHQYAIVLENLWTLHNMGEAKRQKLPLDQTKRPLVKLKDFTIDFGYLILTGYSLEPHKPALTHITNSLFL
ncbi:transposase [Candidatus Bathyarchaeota archaeon]|nr:transposase [Candidatus Bathyarchaeota archaeon]